MAGTYYPQRRTVTAITNAVIPTVTFDVPHGWVTGQLVSFRVPSDWGMPQINEKQGKVLSTPTTDTVTVDIDTSLWGVFAAPVSSPHPDPFCVPIGSGFIKENGIVKTNIECAFDKRPP